jgi:hypothetical protein
MSEPYCLAMVLCDAVHFDRATGKQTILGTFSTIGANSFPTRAAFAVYFALTDITDETEMTFRVVDSRHGFDEQSVPLVEIPLPVQSPSPLAVFEGFCAVNLELPSSGVYHCELLIKNEVLMSRRLVAMQPSDLKGEL